MKKRLKSKANQKQKQKNKQYNQNGIVFGQSHFFMNCVLCGKMGIIQNVKDVYVYENDYRTRKPWETV